MSCIDERTAIQSLERHDSAPPSSPGRAERHEIEHFRRWTLRLFAVFDMRCGTVFGKTVRRHTSADFAAFLTGPVAQQPANKEVRGIADKLSAYKTQMVYQYLANHSNDIM